MAKLIRGIVGSLFVLLMSGAHAAPTYTAYAIGNFGVDWTYGYGLNNSGQVTGISALGDGSQHAFITGWNGVGMTDIGTLGGWQSRGSAINDAGQVSGSSYTLSGTRAFITGTNGVGITDLGVTQGAIDSTGSGINGYGAVTGSVYFSGSQRAFVTGPDGVGMSLLGTLGGWSSGGADINDSGQVTGGSTLAGNLVSHAFITGSNAVGMFDLGTLGGQSSFGYAINASGQVAGYSDLTGNASFHAFVTGANGAGMSDIGTLGGSYSNGFGINSFGSVVGMATLVGDNIAHAFLYSNGDIFDINDLVATLLAPGEYFYDARAINDNGQIVVTTSYERTYLLTQTASVPEPSTCALMLASLGLLGVARRRRNHAQA